MTQTNNPGSVIVDANIVIAICAREKDKLAKAEAALKDYASRGWDFYAPSIIIGEVLYVLCQKAQSGILTATEYEEAIQDFQDQMAVIHPPPNSDSSLIKRANEIRGNYGCSRSADSIYTALAEDLLKIGVAELLTFDQDIVNQVAKNAPSVKVNLLPI
jgi:predicted nucleic acid-binding protein